MAQLLSRVFRRMMSSGPTSHFITLANRPLVLPNGRISQGPLKIHYWKWAGAVDGTTVLFCHATSFHGRCYDRIIEEALRGYHVIALDFRGHGRSQKHPPPYRFRWIGDDLVQFIEQLDLPSNDIIGIGHSMGGYALTVAATTAPTRRFKSLILFDPVILSQSLYGALDDQLSVFDYISRRKSQWSSIDEMIARLEKREPFSRFPKDVLRNYCTYALDENHRLACTPEGEASIYRSSSEPNTSIYKLIEQSQTINDIPVHIIRSSKPNITGQFDTSPTTPDLVRWFKKGHDTQLSNANHLFPMEDPQLTIDLVKNILEREKKSHHHF